MCSVYLQLKILDIEINPSIDVASRLIWDEYQI